MCAMLKIPRPLTNFILASSCMIALIAPENALAFDDDGHEEINDQALRFLEEDLLDQIKESNHDEDEGASNDYAERHLCNCRFSQFQDYINFRYRNVFDSITAYEPDIRKPTGAAGLQPPSSKIA